MTLKAESPLLVKGSLEREEGSGKILVESVERLDDLMAKSKRITLNLDSSMIPGLERLKQTMGQFSGNTQVLLRLHLNELHRQVDLELKDPPGVRLCSELFESIQSIYGHNDFVSLN
jgi:hypothetical protein